MIMRQNLNDIIDHYHSPREDKTTMLKGLKWLFRLEIFRYLLKVVRAWLELPFIFNNIRCELQKISAEIFVCSDTIGSIRFRLWDVAIKINTQTSVYADYVSKYECNHREMMDHIKNVTTNSKQESERIFE